MALVVLLYSAPSIPCMSEQKTYAVTSLQSVSRYCYLWTGATVDVCFYNRADTETKGDFKVTQTMPPRALGP